MITLTGFNKQSAGEYEAEGYITIKDVQESVSVPVYIAETNDAVSVSTSFKIDRTRFGIVYKSKSLGGEFLDNFIYDEFTIKGRTVISK